MGPIILIVLGVISLYVSYGFGSQFYPPGEGYGEEFRNAIVCLFLLVIGLFLIAVGFLSTGVSK